MNDKRIAFVNHAADSIDGAFHVHDSLITGAVYIVRPNPTKTPGRRLDHVPAAEVFADDFDLVAAFELHRRVVILGVRSAVDVGRIGIDDCCEWFVGVGQCGGQASKSCYDAAQGFERS